MKLEEYLEKYKTPKAAFARKLGVSARNHRKHTSRKKHVS